MSLIFLLPCDNKELLIINSFPDKSNTDSFVSLPMCFKPIPTSHLKPYLKRVGFKLWSSFIYRHTSWCLSTSYPSTVVNTDKSDLFTILWLKPLHFKDWNKFRILFIISYKNVRWIQWIVHLLQTSVHIFFRVCYCAKSEWFWYSGTMSGYLAGY